MEFSEDLLWREREGRFPDDTPFHEWSYQHASGRLLAMISGPPDRRGGFVHEATFLFNQNVTMPGGPFLFTDFDSAKRFVESVIAGKVTSISTEGALEVVKPPDQLAESMKQAMLLGVQAMQPKIPAV